MTKRTVSLDDVLRSILRLDLFSVSLMASKTRLYNVVLYSRAGGEISRRGSGFRFRVSLESAEDNVRC